jgi:hypothetical protein
MPRAAENKLGVIATEPTLPSLSDDLINSECKSIMVVVFRHITWSREVSTSMSREWNIPIDSGRQELRYAMVSYYTAPLLVGSGTGARNS